VAEPPSHPTRLSQSVKTLPSTVYRPTASQRIARIAHYLAVLLLILLLLTPLIAFLFNAFSFRWFYPQLFPQELSFRAWESIAAANSRVPEALLNSTILAVGVTLSSVVIGLPAARALGLYSFRGKRVIEFLIISPTIVPYILTFLIGAGQVITMPVLLFSTASGNNNALTAAMSLVFVAPAILILILTARYLSGKSSAIGGFGQI